MQAMRPNLVMPDIVSVLVRMCVVFLMTGEGVEFVKLTEARVNLMEGLEETQQRLSKVLASLG